MHAQITRGCYIIIIIIVLFLLGSTTTAFLLYDTMPDPPSPPKPHVPPDTMDKFTFSQYLSTSPNKSATKTVTTSNNSIVGDSRQLFLAPPTDQGSNVLVYGGKLRYTYNGQGANGFEVRWLGYISGDTKKFVVDLENVKKFTVDISSLNLKSTNSTFTLQMNVRDSTGLESSVVNIISTPKTAVFDQSSFIGNEPGQRPNFSKITGIWLGGDFRTVDASTGGMGNVTIGPLLFDRS